jgi:transcriptional regulator with PAS, ATPase and Fis domain
MAHRMETEQHLDAIIASAATAAILQEHVTIPVIPLHIQNDNIFEALHEALKVGMHIGFADINKNTRYDLNKISQIMRIPIKVYPFNSLDQTDSIVDQAKADGIDVLLTPASCMHHRAATHNLCSVLIRLNEQQIMSAIETAVHLLMIREQQAVHDKWMRIAFDCASNGLIAIDSNHVVTAANTTALEALRQQPTDILDFGDGLDTNKTISVETMSDGQELPELTDGKGRRFTARLRHVHHKDRYLGSLIRLDEVRSMSPHIRELKTKKRLASDGFVARYEFSDIVGDSAKILEAKSKALTYARSDATVLILGESGTGKEIFAQSIHNASQCAAGPFIAANCATLPESLMDSELFGYEGGAFTGARKEGKPGLFEMADGGTLFLDEIGDMPAHLQVKLLRVLQERTVRRIGGEKNIPFDVRMIFATNKNLHEAMKNGTFREDLYYRINVLELHLPPLRERAEDIPLLVAHMIRENAGYRTHIEISNRQYAAMQRYPWPGNVRELRNFVDRLVALNGPSDSFCVNEGLLQSLDSADMGRALAAPPDSDHLVVPIGTLREIENSVISQLFARYGKNKQEVERVLGMSSTTIWRRFKEMKATS